LLGSARAAKAPPDGYTILINDLALPSAPLLRSNLPFDVRTDLIPVGLINAGPMVLISRRSLGPETAGQLFAKIIVEKDNLKMGHGGVGSNSHMCGLLIQQALGVTVTGVPYRGTGPKAFLSGVGRQTLAPSSMELSS
jgi:tripartite-type tricarboxylate transporter receptor subunit TctC